MKRLHWPKMGWFKFDRPNIFKVMSSKLIWIYKQLISQLLRITDFYPASNKKESNIYPAFPIWMELLDNQIVDERKHLLIKLF